MATGPIISWQIDWETVTNFIFLYSKITADGDCSHEFKRHLLLGKKSYDILDSIVKHRDSILKYIADKGPSSQSYDFSSSHVCSCILAWTIPWTEEPGGLWSIESQRVGTQLKQLSTHTCMHGMDVRVGL